MGSAVPLSRGNLTMAQEVLDGSKVLRIAVEKLSREFGTSVVFLSAKFCPVAECVLIFQEFSYKIWSVGFDRGE